MPHCIVEYSKDLPATFNIEQVLLSLFEVLKDSAEFEEASIKLRAIAYPDLLSGLDEHSFVHVRLHILSGRSTAQKRALTEAMVEHLSPQLNMVKSLSAEVVDIQRESYSKRVI
ncbi:5-carboxymethyl-2-hydroxymuconate Delta-isomerase [Agarivorans sp. 1_MG-2023]|uniref:5-carboxymethyl-2-hydroxymuconate Delta-isomerase n=1 Tax=Agarivorans sp. 1_MG-2023 TaxID=3062634 RepID=UPI0026E2990D|nr:5-carboxymethyl-2-hydroxymuconate Delta-isomerase [Agarivorans sp. 1_MG-2023]MDO6763656.1 5-carboxymethyl-2-hydroxymuconate Delta-isomerase [Agarivorans sp. 1_MG-2023]